MAAFAHALQVRCTIFAHGEAGTLRVDAGTGGAVGGNPGVTQSHQSDQQERQQH